MKYCVFGVAVNKKTEFHSKLYYLEVEATCKGRLQKHCHSTDRLSLIFR